MRSAFDAAMQYLARREHALSELKVKLLQKGFTVPEVEQALKACQVQGYQSDRRYAESLIRTRVKQGWGPLRVQQELEQALVATETINELMQAYHEQWSLEIRRVWQKKFKTIKPCDYLEIQKQKKFLHYRGFTSESINAFFQSVDESEH